MATSLSDNVLTLDSATLTGSGTALTANGTISATSFSGDLSGNASSASKLGSATVGGAKIPIYLNNGTATAGTALGDAAYKGVTSTASSGSTNLITSGGVYTVIGDINSILDNINGEVV